MIRKTPFKKKRMAISVVIGTVIMFAMLISVAGSYFYFIQQDQAAFQKSINQQNSNLLNDQIAEHYTVDGISQSGELAFYINNTGVSISIVSYWILNASNSAIIEYSNTTNNINLPIQVGQGQSVTFPATSLNPNIIIPPGGEYVIKLLTSKGTQAIGTYPSQQITGSTVQSLVAGGFGSLQISFSSFSWYSYLYGPSQTVTYTQSTAGQFGGGGTTTETYNNLCANSNENETNCSNSQPYQLDVAHPHSGSLVPGGYNATVTQYSTTTQRNIVGGIAIDGSTNGYFSGSSGAVSLSTSSSNDVIVVEVSINQGYCNYYCPSVNGVSSPGLSFTQRSHISHNRQDLEVWYAIATSPLSSQNMAVTLTNSANFATIVAFGVSGANTQSPWDNNPYKTNYNSQSTPYVNGYSTSNAYDMVLGFEGNYNFNSQCSTSETPGSGYTLIQDYAGCSGNYGEDAAAEYQVVGSTQSYNVAFGTSTGYYGNWVMVADAIQGAATTKTSTTTATTSYAVGTTHEFYQVPIAFSVNVTNYDPSLATIVLNSATNLWVIETCDSGVTEGTCPSGNPFYVFYIMNVNSTTGKVTSTSPGSFSQIEIPYGVTKTIYYGAAYDLSLQSFSPVGLTSALSNNPFYYGQFAVFLLLAGTKIVSPNVLVYGQNIPFESTTAADNFGWINETPVITAPGSLTNFTLSVNDSIFATAVPKTQTQIGVQNILINASAFNGVSATGFSPPTGWTVSYPQTGYIDWVANSSNYYITNGTTDIFDWSATAPSPSAQTQYIFPITITWSSGEITTMQEALVCTVP